MAIFDRHLERDQIQLMQNSVVYEFVNRHPIDLLIVGHEMLGHR